MDSHCQEKNCTAIEALPVACNRGARYASLQQMINHLRQQIILVIVTFLSLVPGSSAETNTEKPDILFIMVDDLNDWVGPLEGHPQVRTPNIDKLAARGMTFRNAHAPAPLCSPSRTALLTGLKPSTTGVYDNRPDWRDLDAFNAIPSLPKYFNNNGYNTLGAGKIFHAHTFEPEGLKGYNDLTAWDSFYPSVDRQLPEEMTPPLRPANGNPVAITFDWAALDIYDETMGDGKITTWITRQISEETGGPRFIAAGIYRPHLPWYTPSQYFDLYQVGSIKLPETIPDDLDDVPSIATRPFLELTDKPPMAEHRWVADTGKWQDGVQAYLASISFADAQVGRIMEALDASGRVQNTIIVLISDHGFHLGEKERWRKDTLWEEATRIPFIIVAPGITTPASHSNRPVSLMDIYPTLAELAGLDVPPHVEGNSLVPLLEDSSAPWKHVALTTAGFRNHSVRDERYRYTRWSDGSEELYDHYNDPHEWENLAGADALAGIKQELASKLPNTNAPPNR